MGKLRAADEEVSIVGVFPDDCRRPAALAACQPGRGRGPALQRRVPFCARGARDAAPGVGHCQQASGRNHGLAVGAGPKDGPAIRIPDRRATCSAAAALQSRPDPLQVCERGGSTYHRSQPLAIDRRCVTARTAMDQDALEIDRLHASTCCFGRHCSETIRSPKTLNRKLRAASGQSGIARSNCVWIGAADKARTPAHRDAGHRNGPSPAEEAAEWHAAAHSTAGSLDGRIRRRHAMLYPPQLFFMYRSGSATVRCAPPSMSRRAPVIEAACKAK